MNSRGGKRSSNVEPQNTRGPTQSRHATQSPTTENETVRIHFYEPDVGYENLLAKPLTENLYKIESVPFFVYDIAVGDIIRALADQEGYLEPTQIVQHSGNKTLRARADRFA